MVDTPDLVARYLDALEPLEVEARPMFGCWCLYCDAVPVGWISNGQLDLKKCARADQLPDAARQVLQRAGSRPIPIYPSDRTADWLVPLVRATAAAVR